MALQAWPDPLPGNVGATFSMSHVAAERTASDGGFRFTAAQVAGSPAAAQIPAVAAANHGWVNFQVVGETPGAVGEQNFARRLAADGTWSLAGTPAGAVAVRAITGIPAANYSRALTARPNDPPPSCVTTVKDTAYKGTRVGETHRWHGVGATFHYEHVADSNIDIGLGVGNDKYTRSRGTSTSAEASPRATQ